MKPKLNVAVAAFNVEDFIEQSVESVINFADHLTIMEGGWNPTKENKSTDRTIEIIYKLKDKYPDKIDIFHCYNFDWYNNIDKYPVKCDKHKWFLESAMRHPYYDGPSLQNQLMARDYTLQHLVSKYAEGEDPGFLMFVDADEIYEEGSMLNLIDYISIMGDEYDLFGIEAINFYFKADYYKNESYYRVLRIKKDCYQSNDNWFETPDDPKAYSRLYNISPELVKFYHYNYISKQRINKKLDMWHKEDVDKWFATHQDLIDGKEYDGRDVHLFGHKNPGYSNYKLSKFEGTHPKIMQPFVERLRNEG